MGNDSVGKPMGQRFIRWTMQVILSLAVTALLGAACTEIAGHVCTDPDYPLKCEDNKACCPNGKPFNCGGMCYQTRDQAVRDCGARIDTCYRE